MKNHFIKWQKSNAFHGLQDLHHLCTVAFQKLQQSLQSAGQL